MEKEAKELPCIEILTPLTGNFIRDGDYYESNQEYGEALEGRELVQYEKPIADMVDRYNRLTDDGKPCNLMDYFSGSRSVQDKVESAVISVKKREGVLYGCTTLNIREYLEAPELKELCEYITGQYADGWGEAFEQKGIAVDEGTLYIHFWQTRGYEIQKRAVKKEEQSTAVPDPEKRPALKLTGHDGNLYSILGDARLLLCKNGQEKESREMLERVENSKNYYQALGIISEYVETELSVPKEKTGSKKNKERGDECR